MAISLKFRGISLSFENCLLLMMVSCSLLDAYTKCPIKMVIEKTMAFKKLQNSAFWNWSILGNSSHIFTVLHMHYPSRVFHPVAIATDPTFPSSELSCMNLSLSMLPHYYTEQNCWNAELKKPTTRRHLFVHNLGFIRTVIGLKHENKSRLLSRTPTG